MHVYGLSEYDATQICTEKHDVEYYQILAEKTGSNKSAANWLTGPVRNYCSEKNIGTEKFPLTAKNLGELIKLTESGKIHFNISSSRLMEAMIQDQNSDASAETLAGSMNLLQEKDEGLLEKWADEAIASMPDKVKEYRSGKKGLIGLFVGQVKKLSKGKADMQAVTKLLEEKLKAGNQQA